MKYNYKPTAKDYLRSLRRRIKESLLENSLHGVKYVMDIKRPKWERISWFILIMLSFVAIAVTIFVVWMKFQTEPTITGLDLETDIKINFPKIFICFDWHQLNYTHIQQNERHVYEQVYNWTWEDYIDEYEPVYEKKVFLNVFRRMAPKCGNVIFNCKYKGVKQSCYSLFSHIVVAVGVCCKLNTVEPLAYSDANRDLEFETTSSYYPWRLYFQANTDISPKREERPLVKAYFPITLEFHIDLTFTTPDIRYLTLRQRNCTYKQKGDSLDNCMMYHVKDQLLSRCNCVPWFLAFMEERRICPLSKYHCLSNFTVNPNDMNCWLLCDHTSYGVDAILKSSTNTNRIVLKFWPRTFMKVEMRFGYLDLLVSFGGIASLFLGYSLLASVEIGYYATLRSYCGAVIHISRQQYNITTIHVTQKVPNKLILRQQYHDYIE
ncbi:sodium channel protein Nach [Megalopta genalis]|uniref:sodium channel protein Nach n=1 Tax=Megalopta genalis TaxID=115081 RepID=UPI003FD5B363